MKDAMKEENDTSAACSGNDLLNKLEALANPHRLQIIALLSKRRMYVSQLAREISLSRPLLYMHLRRLEKAGLVTSRLELSADGKAMNYYEVSPFAMHLHPESIAEAVKTLSLPKLDRTNKESKEKEDRP